MSSRVALKIDRHRVVRGAWFGVLLVAAGFFAFQALCSMLLGVGPHSVMAPLLRIAGLTLVGLLLFPIAVLLFGSVVAAAQHRNPYRWIAMAIGAAVAAMSLVLTVLAATGVIALIVA